MKLRATGLCVHSKLLGLLGLLRLGAAFFSSLAMAVTSTDALPRGVRAAALVYGFAPEVDSSFDPDGKLEYLTSPLNRSVTFEELADFEPELKQLKNVIDSFYPHSAGNQLLQAELYADANVYEQRYVPALLWGLTERLSIGAMLPLSKREVTASFSTKVLNQGRKLGQLVGEIPQVKEAVQKLADAKIDTELFVEKIFTAHGYDVPQDYTKSGVGDLELEARYLYFKSEMLNLAARLNLKVPTGEAGADVKNLLDRPLGQGAYALKAGLLQDFKPFGPRWNFSSAAFVTYNFRGEERRAVRRTADQLLPDLNDPEQVETLAKQRGIDFSTDLALSRSLFGGVMWFSASYLYAYHGEDRYFGTRSLDYASLSRNTQTTEHGVEYSVEISSIPLFLLEEFPVPAKLVFAWYQPFRGKNAMYTPFGRMDFALLF